MPTPQRTTQEAHDGSRQTGPLSPPPNPLRHAAWLAHAATRGHRTRVDRAKRIIEKSLHRGLAVSVSGGKDSIALLGIVRDIDPSARAVCIDDGLQTAPTYAVLRATPSLDWVPSDMPLQRMMMIAGYWGYRGPEDREHVWTQRAWEDCLLFGPLRRYLHQHGLSGTYVGLRADESRGRKMRAHKYGPEHYLAGRDLWSVCPILDWSGTDSLAAAAARELPISSVYYTAPNPERERTACALGGVAATTTGRFQRLAEVDPDLYRRLYALFPAMRPLT